MSYNNRKLEINERLKQSNEAAVLFYVKSPINVKKKTTLLESIVLQIKSFE